MSDWLECIVVDFDVDEVMCVLFWLVELGLEYEC